MSAGSVPTHHFPVLSIVISWDLGNAQEVQPTNLSNIGQVCQQPQLSTPLTVHWTVDCPAERARVTAPILPISCTRTGSFRCCWRDTRSSQSSRTSIHRHYSIARKPSTGGLPAASCTRRSSTSPLKCLYAGSRQICAAHMLPHGVWLEAPALVPNPIGRLGSRAHMSASALARQKSL